MRSIPYLSQKLKELRFSRYADYLQSLHWRRFKSEFKPRRMRHGYPVCEFCLSGNRRLDLHHRTYKRLGCERQADVVLICSQCHDRVHRWYRGGRKSLWTTTNNVARVAECRRR